MSWLPVRAFSRLFIMSAGLSLALYFATVAQAEYFKCYLIFGELENPPHGVLFEYDQGSTKRFYRYWFEEYPTGTQVTSGLRTDPMPAFNYYKTIYYLEGVRAVESEKFTTPGYPYSTAHLPGGPYGSEHHDYGLIDCE